MFPLFVLVAVIIILERTHEHHSSSIFIAEEGKRLVCGFLQIAEANNITAILDAVDDGLIEKDPTRKAIVKALPQEQSKWYENMTSDIFCRLVGRLNNIIPLEEL